MFREPKRFNLVWRLPMLPWRLPTSSRCPTGCRTCKTMPSFPSTGVTPCLKAAGRANGNENREHSPIAPRQVEPRAAARTGRANRVSAAGLGSLRQTMTGVCCLEPRKPVRGFSSNSGYRRFIGADSKPAQDFSTPPMGVDAERVSTRNKRNRGQLALHDRPDQIRLQCLAQHNSCTGS